MKNTKKIIVSILIFLFWIAIAFASSLFVWKWDNNDAGEINNDLWTITWSIDIEDSLSSDYINNWLRWSIYDYTINSQLFWDIDWTGKKLKFYKSSISPTSTLCWNNTALEVYVFSDDEIESTSWWKMKIDTISDKSYFCSNNYSKIYFKSDHIATKYIWDSTWSTSDVFWKQQININWTINGETWSWILARWDQTTLNLDISDSKKVLLKTLINKNIAKLYLTYRNKINTTDYNITNDINSSWDTNWDIDKDNNNWLYLYDYTWKTESTAIQFDSSNYINQWKNLVIWDWDAEITTINWKNTIIVKSWNIFIRENLDNTDDKKDLLVLIATRDKATGNWWNIYIHPDVTNIDAVLVSDWSLISLDWEHIQYAKDLNQAQNLRRQLLIYGSVLSSNSIWTDTIPFWADYYEKKVNNELEKSIYDLWNLRTFNLKYWRNTAPDYHAIDKLVPIKSNSIFLENAWAWKCKWYNWENCDANLRKSIKVNPLIIEYNFNIQKISPYIITNK